MDGPAPGVWQGDRRSLRGIEGRITGTGSGGVLKVVSTLDRLLRLDSSPLLGCPGLGRCGREMAAPLSPHVEQAPTQTWSLIGKVLYFSSPLSSISSSRLIPWRTRRCRHQCSRLKQPFVRSRRTWVSPHNLQRTACIHLRTFFQPIPSTASSVWSILHRRCWVSVQQGLTEHLREGINGNRKKGVEER